MAEVRIATFNLENFDETAPDEWPSLAERIQLMRPQVVRLRADIACFQEVNGQERPNQPRSLLALADLLTGTNLAGAEHASTRTASRPALDHVAISSGIGGSTSRRSTSLYRPGSRSISD
jgi:endonuclease/exonuclease/phosphatase family metal-dependent hydrolase